MSSIFNKITGSGNALTSKNEKKILDGEENPLKRYKLLKEFNDGGAETELRSFYQKYYSAVYNIFLDALNTMNAEAKRKGKVIPTNDILGLTSILLNLFKHASNIIQKRWQQRSIIHTLEILLDDQNIFQIRKKGFELLLYFVDIMQENVDIQVLDMVMNVLKFKPFIEENKDVKLPSFQQRQLNADERIEMAQSTNEITLDEAQQVFSLFFSFIKTTSDHFEFWWKFFKTRLFPILYPGECKSLDLLNKLDDMGFVEKCPTKIHLFILDLILHGLESPKNSPILYATDKDIYLFLLIFRQSFLLPAQNYEELSKMMKTYRSWICKDYFLYNWPEIMEKSRNLYFRVFIDNLSQVFFMKGEEQFMDLHMTMCYEVFDIFMFFTQITDKVDFETWSDLLFAHMRIFTHLIERKNRIGDDNNYDTMFGDMLEKTCIRNLFIIWIKSHPSDQFTELWDTLYSLLQKHFTLDSVFNLWRGTVINLARVICEQIFGLPQDKIRISDFIQYTTELYSISIVKKKAKSSKTPNVYQGMKEYLTKLNIEIVLHLFHKFLNMFGNENTQLASGTLHAKKMSVLKELVDIFLDIERQEIKVIKGTTGPPFLHSPEGNRIFEIFMEWIVESCERMDEQFEPGRVTAYTMLCDIITTKFSQPIQKHFLANAYRVLFKGLVVEYGATDKTIEAIIKNGWQMFGLGHIGANILLPYFVQACQKVLKESSATVGVETKQLRIAAVQGLTSIISLCYMYGDRPLPHVETILKMKQARLTPEALKEQGIESPSYHTYNKLRAKVCQILMGCVEDDRFYEVQIKCIWGLYSILHHELQTSGVSGRSSTVKWIIEIFMKLFVDKNTDVACAAHDAVVTIAHGGLLPKLGVPTIRTLLLTVCTALSSQLKNTDQSLEQWSVFKHIFYSLIEILQYVPMKILEGKEVATFLFSAIYRGLSVVPLSVLLTPQKEGPTGSGSVIAEHPPSSGGDEGDRASKMYTFENYTLNRDESAIEIATAAEALLCYALNVYSQFPSPIGAARMSTQVSEFDVLQEENGVFVPSPKVHHFVFNNYTLLTVMENPTNKTESCVFILRDMTGKYCWEFKQVFSPETMTFKRDDDIEIEEELDELVDDDDKSVLLKKGNRHKSVIGHNRAAEHVENEEVEEKRSTAFFFATVNRNSADEELFDADDVRAEPFDQEEIDFIDLALELEELFNIGLDSEPYVTPEDIKVPGNIDAGEEENEEEAENEEEEEGQEKAEHLQESQDQEQEDEGEEELDYPHYDIEIDTDKTDMLEVLQHYVSQVFPECGEYAAPTVTTINDLHIDTTEVLQKAESYYSGLGTLMSEVPKKPFEKCAAPIKPNFEKDELSRTVYKAFRALLNNIGFLSGASRPSFSLISANSRFYRSLKQLDKLGERETIKVGLLYVANQQETQKDILSNDEQSGSKIYKEFVQSLAWDVDLKTHDGFLGGLDENLTTGLTAPYYSNSTTEVIFHDVTRMPTKQNDTQQIQKKRHVGNDFVHIVWSENDRDYKPWTITSQFNFVHICIYPLQQHKDTHLFRVRIHTKPEVPLFGPLLDGMIIDKKNLGKLVRMTAINANKAVRYKQKQYKKPFPTRRSHINEIIQRHKATNTSNIDFIKTFFIDQDYVSVESKKLLSPTTTSTTPTTTTNSVNTTSTQSLPVEGSFKLRGHSKVEQGANKKANEVIQQQTTAPTTTAPTTEEDVIEEVVEEEIIEEVEEEIVEEVVEEEVIEEEEQVPQEQNKPKEEVQYVEEVVYVDENGQEIHVEDGDDVEYVEEYVEVDEDEQ
ncbi:hypothetical protein ABK040_001072 [Willaertia magna]